MQITTTTIQGKTGLEIESLIREAYQAGERNFTTDLPTDIFDPSSISSTQIDADGTPCTDWGFNVGEWDASTSPNVSVVAARVSAYWKPRVVSKLLAENLYRNHYTTAKAQKILSRVVGANGALAYLAAYEMEVVRALENFQETATIVKEGHLYNGQTFDVVGFPDSSTVDLGNGLVMQWKDIERGCRKIDHSI